MRRAEIILGARTLIKDIEDSGLARMIDQAIEVTRTRSDSKSRWFSLNTFQEFAVRYSSWSQAAKAVAKIFALDRLGSGEFWQEVTEEDASPTNVYAIRNDIRFAMQHLPQLVELLSQDHVDTVRSGSGKAPEQLRGKEMITIYLAEDAEVFSSPQRLIDAIGGFAEIYGFFARLDGAEGNDLVVGLRLGER